MYVAIVISDVDKTVRPVLEEEDGDTMQTWPTYDEARAAIDAVPYKPGRQILIIDTDDGL